MDILNFNNGNVKEKIESLLSLDPSKRNITYHNLKNGEFLIFYHVDKDGYIIFEAITKKENLFQSSYLFLKLDYDYQKIESSPFSNYNTSSIDSNEFYAYILEQDYFLAKNHPDAYLNKYRKIKTKEITSENRNKFLNLIQDISLTNSFSPQYENDIRLEVHIDQQDEFHFLLSLYLGIDKLYLIPSLSTFLSLINQNGFYAYSPELAFSHYLSSFTKGSQRVIEELIKIFSYNDIQDYCFRLNQETLLYLLTSLKGQILVFNNENYYVNQDVTKVYLKFNDDQSNFCFSIESKEKAILSHSIGMILDSENKIISLLSFQNEKEQKLFSFVNQNPTFPFEEVSDLIKNELNAALNSTRVNNQYIIMLFITLENDILTLKSHYYHNEEELSKDQAYLDFGFKDKLLNYLKVLKSLNLEENIIIKDQNQIIKILQDDVKIIKEYAEIYLSENIKNKVIKKASKLHFKLSFDLDFLSLKYDNSKGDINLANQILNAYRKKKKFILYRDEIQVLDYEDLDALNELLNDFQVRKLDDESPKLPLYTLFKVNSYKDAFLIDVDHKVQNIFDSIRNFKLQKYPLNSHLKSILKPYQIDAFKYLMTMYKYHLNAILADDMGLGKTLEMISFISSINLNYPALIVSPKSVVYNWENEFKIWNQDLKIQIIDGDKNYRNQVINSLTKNTIYITSYDALRNDIELYKNKRFSLIILDEGQYIKNADALKTKAVKELSSESKFILTGTPIENSLADLWSLFDFILPNYLLSYSQFKREYEVPILNGSIEAKKRLLAKIKPFILRRTKAEVLKELPSKIEEINIVTLSQKQRELYDAYLTKAKYSFRDNQTISTLAMLTRLRETCLDPSMFLEDFDEISSKLTRTVELISRSLANNHKVIVFSSFKSCLDHLQVLVKKDGIDAYFIHGGVDSIKRLELAKDFNENNNSPRVMLVSLKAGGTGLNLIGGDIVILLDPWWNTSAENQAFDRAYRLGQKNNVTVIKLICRDTLETKILHLQELKKSLTNDFISSSDKAITSLSKEDIEYLLS